MLEYETISQTEMNKLDSDPELWESELEMEPKEITLEFAKGRVVPATAAVRGILKDGRRVRAEISYYKGESNAM
jgi:hypothetical protein